MNAHDEQDLRDLLHDAVADVEPERSVDDVLSRVGRPPARRSWLLVSGGVVLGAAAAAAAVAAFGGGPGTHRTDAGVASGGGAPVTSAAPTPPPSESPSQTPEPSPVPESSALPVYLSGDTAQGPGLYRDFEPVADPQPDGLTAAVNRSVAGTSTDPDYGTLWPAGTTVRAAWLVDDVINVDLDGADLESLSSTMTADQARIAVQQVVYTAQAVMQSRAPVQLLVHGHQVPTVLGVPASEPIAQDSPLATLSHISITTPTEGATVSGSFAVSGVANSFEANVVCGVLNGGHAYGDNPFTATGWQADRLFPFQGTIDVSSIPPGSYSLTCMTDDPSGGAEGNGPDRDTRTINVS